MPIEQVTAAAAEWERKQPACQTYSDYMAGRHQLKFATKDWTDKYSDVVGNVVLSIRENLCPAAVTVFTDGIEVEDWGAGDNADQAWQEGMQRLEALVNREGFSAGDSFVLVWPDADGNDVASFQPSHAMIPHVDPLRPDRLDWCAKVWKDKRGRVNIYSGTHLERWETVEELEDKADMPKDPKAWRPATDAEGPTVPHKYNGTPVAWFKREATTQTGPGVSVLDDVIPLQDALNKSLADLIVTSEGYSRPFWYLLNHKQGGPVAPTNPLIPTIPIPGGGTLTGVATNGGTPTPSSSARFDPTAQRIFTTDGGGPFGQLDPPDLTKVADVQDRFALKVARVIGAPSFWFTQTSGDVPSGEALRVLSSRRLSRIRAWQRDAAPVWRGVKQLLGMDDGPIAWANPLELDPVEKYQVALDQKALGYDLQDIVEGLGEADAKGIVSRARTTPAQVGRAFMNGEDPANYGE